MRIIMFVIYRDDDEIDRSPGQADSRSFAPACVRGIQNCEIGERVSRFAIRADSRIPLLYFQLTRKIVMNLRIVIVSNPSPIN